MRGNVVAAEGKSGTLVLSEQAQIEGEIRVSHVVINGTVVGPVHAAEYVELQAKANVTGDVYYKTLEIQLGAVVQGRLVYQNEGKSDKVSVQAVPRGVRSATQEHDMNAVTETMPEPLVFTDAAAAKVKQLIDEEGNHQPQAAGIRPGRRLLGLPVRVHLRRGGERRRHRAWSAAASRC